jgi:hypothetical protein
LNFSVNFSWEIILSTENLDVHEPTGRRMLRV